MQLETTLWKIKEISKMLATHKVNVESLSLLSLLEAETQKVKMRMMDKLESEYKCIAYQKQWSAPIL